MLGPRRRRQRQSRQSAPPPSLLPENIARGGAHSNSTVSRRGFFYFSGKYHMRTTHNYKDQIAAKLHSGWTPHPPKPWGSLGDTSAASTVLESNARSPGRGGP